MLLPSFMHAEENEKFSRMMCNIVSSCQTVKECSYNKEKEILFFQTRDGKEKKVLCLWFDQNEKNQVVIDATDIALKGSVDYVLIGYAQSPTNPRLYYYIPSRKITKNLKLHKMDKYLLSWPIAGNKF